MLLFDYVNNHGLICHILPFFISIIECYCCCCVCLDNRTIEISINGKENKEINCKRLE